MNGLHPLALGCWHWLARVSWQASVLILLVLIVQWVCRRWMSPAWRHSLWLLVVARLVLPVSLESRVSVFNWLGIHSPANTPRRLVAPISLSGAVLPTAEAIRPPAAARPNVQPSALHSKAEL